MRLLPTLILSIGLGPLWWPISILGKAHWHTINRQKIMFTAAQLDAFLGIESDNKRARASCYYEYINKLNNLKNLPTADLLIKILDESCALNSTDPHDEETELLLLAKCALAEAHLIFSSVLALTGDVDLALHYWKTKLEKQHKKPFLDHLQTMPTSWRTKEEIQEKIDTLEAIQSINTTYIGQLAAFITNAQTLTNKTALRQLLSEHTQKAAAFLENQKDIGSYKQLDNKALNRQLAQNVSKVSAYKKNMDTTNKDLARPSHLERNWLWYVGGMVGALGIGSYIHKKRSQQNVTNQTEFEAFQAAFGREYTSWWSNPITRIKELFSGKHNPPLIDPGILLSEMNSSQTATKNVIEGFLKSKEPYMRPWGINKNYRHRNSDIQIALPEPFNSWDDVIEMNYNTLQAPENAKNTLIESINTNTQLGKIENYKQDLIQWVETIWSFKKKYSKNDESTLAEIQTDLASSPISNFAGGQLPQVYNAQMQSFMVRIRQYASNLSNQINDMELTIKLLALLPASLVIYVAYRIGKKAHDKALSKEPIFTVMRHITRQIGKILNKNNTYITSTPSFEDQGHLIFWINKLRTYAKTLSGDEKSDFKEDLNELECEEYQVGQKLQTLQRMYNTYGFLRSGK